MVRPPITELPRSMHRRFSVLALVLVASCGTLIGEDFGDRSQGCRDPGSGELRRNCAPENDLAAVGGSGAGNASTSSSVKPIDDRWNSGGRAGERSDAPEDPISSAGTAGAQPSPGIAERSGGGEGGAGEQGGQDGGKNSPSPTGQVRPAFEGPSWPNKLMRVCWRDQMERPDIASHVESVVRNTWGRVAGLRILGWGACPMDAAGWVSVALDGSSDGDIDGIGAENDARLIWLGMNMANFDAAVVHLFGHAVGFGHGGLGPNEDVTTGGCEPSDVGLEPAAYWQRSVMSLHGHCGAGEPAPWDVEALQTAYGRKGMGAIVGFGNRCLDIPGELAQQWQPLQIYECNFWWNQSWSWTKDGQLFVPYAPALVIDVAEGAATHFLQLFALNQPSSGNQQFTFANGQLRALGDSCLGVTSAGSQLVQAGPCELFGDQAWLVGSDGRIQVGDRCLTAPSVADASFTATACEQTENQIFTFSRIGQVRQGSGCLEVIDEGDPEVNRSVRLTTCRAETDPLVLHQELYFRGRVLSGGQCMHVTGQTSIDNGGLEMVECSPDDASQWWDYYPTSSP
jgi:hypothetical protein